MKMGHNKISADDVIKKLSAKELEQVFKFFEKKKKLS